VSPLPVLAQEQAPSLVEVAQKEKERRAAIAATSRVYTNDDLGGGPRLTTGTAPTRQPAASPEPVVTSAPTRSAGEPESAREEYGEDYWRNRVTTARTEKRRAEVTAAALQNRIDGLWAVLTARDDPFQRADIEQDRFEAIRLLETTRTEIQRLDQEIQDIQEEARRANVPPGWLR
jgi:DNA repair exonuclease SbcCD ATPase subunit